jgi:hypothetical protein
MFRKNNLIPALLTAGLGLGLFSCGSDTETVREPTEGIITTLTEISPDDFRIVSEDTTPNVDPELHERNFRYDYPDAGAPNGYCRQHQAQYPPSQRRSAQQRWILLFHDVQPHGWSHTTRRCLRQQYRLQSLSR